MNDRIILKDFERVLNKAIKTVPILMNSYKLRCLERLKVLKERLKDG